MGPYEIRSQNSQIPYIFSKFRFFFPFKFFWTLFFSILIFARLCLMVKLNVIHQEACLINWNHEAYIIKQQFIKSWTKMTFSRPYEICIIFFSNSVFAI